MKETNFNVVETGVTEYTASNGEFVKSSGDKVVLPSPEQNAIVAVRDVGQNLILETPTGLIIDEVEKQFGRSEAAYLISDGADWYAVQDSDVIRGVIPDPEIYLHDDWGDNSLTDREDSGTTTYNGVEGVYRPEWTALNGDSNLSLPSVSDEILTVQSDEGMFADLNLNLDETVTWEYSNVDPSDGDSGSANNIWLGLFADDTDDVDLYAERSYAVRVRNDEIAELIHHSDKSSSDGWTRIVSGSTAISGEVDITVTRASDGEWELLVDGSSEGTGTDTQSTDPSYLPIWCHPERDSVVVDVDEIKVF